MRQGDLYYLSVFLLLLRSLSRLLNCDLESGLEVHVRKTKLNHLLLADDMIILGAYLESGLEVHGSALRYENRSPKHYSCLALGVPWLAFGGNPNEENLILLLIGFQRLEKWKNVNFSRREDLLSPSLF